MIPALEYNELQILDSPEKSLFVAIIESAIVDACRQVRDDDTSAHAKQMRVAKRLAREYIFFDESREGDPRLLEHCELIGWGQRQVNEIRKLVASERWDNPGQRGWGNSSKRTRA